MIVNSYKLIYPILNSICMIEAKLFQRLTSRVKTGLSLMFMLFTMGLFAQVKGVITDGSTGEPLMVHQC